MSTRHENQESFIADEVYHVFNKSIAGYKVLNDDSDYSRLNSLIRYYQCIPSVKYSVYKKSLKNGESESFLPPKRGDQLVEIIAYCFMPTHIHLILRQISENGLSTFMNNVCNSYSRYFNIKYNRKGPLWMGRFKRVLVQTDEQLLHLTRYVHLNPVTSHLVDAPEEWRNSSYDEYLCRSDEKVCRYGDLLDVRPEEYKEFVNDNISYQRERAQLKKLVFE